MKRSSSTKKRRRGNVGNFIRLLVICGKEEEEEEEEEEEKKKKEGKEKKRKEERERERERGRKKIALLRIRGVRTSPDREGMQLKNSSRRRIIDSFVSAEQEDIISVLLLANSSSNQPIPLPPPPPQDYDLRVMCNTSSDREFNNYNRHVR